MTPSEQSAGRDSRPFSNLYHLARLRRVVPPLFLDRGGRFRLRQQTAGLYRGMSGAVCTALGFCNEYLVDAAAAQMRQALLRPSCFQRQDP